jgi:hypothetical protein
LPRLTRRESTQLQRQADTHKRVVQKSSAQTFVGRIVLRRIAPGNLGLLQQYLPGPDSRTAATYQVFARSHPSCNDFCRSVLHFLRVEVPKNWAVFCDSVTDNFRVINPADFRVLKA